MERTIETSILQKFCHINCDSKKGFITVSFPDDDTEYTISPIKNSEYLVMIQTGGVIDGPMPSVCWCDPVDTWLSENRLSIYSEKDMDNNTVFLVTLMYSELLKQKQNRKVAEAAKELMKAMGV